MEQLEIYAVIELGTRYGAPEMRMNYMGTDFDTALNKFKECFKDVAWNSKTNKFNMTNGYLDLVGVEEEAAEKLATQFDTVFEMLIDDFNSTSKVSFDQEWADDYDEPFKYVLIKRTEG